MDESKRPAEQCVVLDEKAIDYLACVAPDMLTVVGAGAHSVAAIDGLQIMYAYLELP